LTWGRGDCENWLDTGYIRKEEVMRFVDWLDLICKRRELRMITGF
jgi:hypothetical protein